MRKWAATTARQVETVLAGITSGAAISVIPFALINRKHLGSFFTSLSWQKRSFIAVSIITATTVYILHSLFDCASSKTRTVKLLPLLTVLYLCCYTTSAALCQKLNLTVISLPAPVGVQMNDNLFSGASCAIVESLGLNLVIFAAVMQVARRILGRQRHKTILRRLDWSYLVFMTGVSLIFSVWLPLLALPGIFVVLKWAAKPLPESIIN
jgi:hypothetical protein